MVIGSLALKRPGSMFACYRHPFVLFRILENQFTPAWTVSSDSVYGFVR